MADTRNSLVADGFYPGSIRAQVVTDGMFPRDLDEPWFRPPLADSTWTSVATSGASWTGNTPADSAWTTVVPRTPLGNPRV